MTKTTWTNTEIKERLMKEAQAWVDKMNAITSSDNKDWNAYQIYCAKAMQTLECISILTDDDYYIANKGEKDGIYKWHR